MVRGDQDFHLHPKLFGHLFDQFVGAFGAPGVHHMAMTNLKFQGINLVFSNHVDVGEHGLNDDSGKAGAVLNRERGPMGTREDQGWIGKS